jgi:hypothetical protein
VRKEYDRTTGQGTPKMKVTINNTQLKRVAFMAHNTTTTFVLLLKKFNEKDEKLQKIPPLQFISWRRL